MTHLVILSYRSWNVFTFDLPPIVGKPKYFSQSVIILVPNKCCISLLIYEPMFLLKNKEVFCMLMAWLEASSYCPSMCNRF